MKKNILLVFGAFVMTAAVALGLSYYMVCGSTSKLKLLKIKQDVFAPFVFFKSLNISEHVNTAYGKEHSEYMDPFLHGSRVISLIYNGHQKADKNYIISALNTLDQLLAIFDIEGKWGHPAYNEFREGWVSCMDSPVVALACHLAYEATGQKKYKEYRDKIIAKTLIKDIRVSDAQISFQKLLKWLTINTAHQDNIEALLQTTESGSFLIPLGAQQIWLSEYAETKTSASNEYYVLNGYLIALQSIYMLGEATGRTDLKQLYRYALKAYQAKKDSFVYEDGAWSFYMLNPKTINQMHYHLFETTQLHAMSKLTADPFFEQMERRHRRILTSVLAIDVIEKNTSGSPNDRMFLLYRAIPHAYNIDTYALTLKFEDETGAVLGQTHSLQQGSFSERVFVSGLIPPNAVNYSVYFKPADVEMLAFTAPIPKRDLRPETTVPRPFTITPVSNVQKLSAFKLTLGEDKSTQEARLIITPDSPLAKSYTNFWGINVTSSAELGMSIELFDDVGGNAHRYYMPPKKGENLILLNLMGFNNIDQLSEKIVRIDLRFYSVDASVDLSVNSLLEFETAIQMYNYFNNNDFILNEQP